jgi:hypothetical protein
MSTFPYKNPISSEQLNGVQSVERSETFGTNFSVLGVGGYMEVFNLTDLVYTIPPATFGPIEFSGNTIPIQFTKGTGAVFSPDVLTLNSDNISSGRRRLGMLAYVYEDDQIYQFRIDNYESLWTAVTATTAVTIYDFGTLINNTTAAGQNFINAWTASTIEDVSGATHSSAVWKKFSSGSGGTVTSGVTGSGTVNYIPKWTGLTSIGNSQIQDNGVTVSIGSPSSTAAILEVASTSQGVLFPRMTQTQRLSISSPTSGLIVYQTDFSDGLYIYKISGWIQMI